MYEDVYRACNKGGALVNGRYFRWQPLDMVPINVPASTSVPSKQKEPTRAPRTTPTDHAKAVVLLDIYDTILRVYPSQQTAAKKLRLPGLGAGLLAPAGCAADG